VVVALRVFITYPVAGFYGIDQLTCCRCCTTATGIDGANAVIGARIYYVPVDYLLGEGKHATYDKNIIKRIEDIEALDTPTKTAIFNIIDTFLRDAKARKAYA
jgi:hypothetical protein